MREPPGARSERGGGSAGYRATAFRIVGGQLLVTTFLAAALLGWGNERLAWSAAAGGAACLIPSAWLAARMFHDRGDASPQRLLGSFYLAEVVKIVLTAAIFAVGLIYLELHALVMLLAYMAAVSVYWLALIVKPGEAARK